MKVNSLKAGAILLKALFSKYEQYDCRAVCNLQPSNSEIACCEQVLKQKNIQQNITKTSRYMSVGRRVAMNGSLVDIFFYLLLLYHQSYYRL